MGALETRTEIDRLLGTASDVMNTQVVVLRPDASLADAARDLERAGVSGAPVLDGGHVVGVVELRDLFEAAGVAFGRVATTGPWHRYEHVVAHADKTVRDVMDERVATVAPDTPLAEIAARMRSIGASRVPVLDGSGRLRGIVARDDILDAVVAARSS